VIAFLDSFGGIPSHPLLVHIPVVLVPLATIGVVAIAIRPSLMRHYGVPVAAVAVIGFLGSVLAASSGEALEDQFRDAGQTIAGTLADHVEMGDNVKIFAFLFVAATVGWVVVTRRGLGRSKHAAVILMVLALLTGGVATWSVVATGHSGATSVWEQPEP
jgi:hypothetical protein